MALLDGYRPLGLSRDMATWGEFEAEQPALAANVRERFDVHKHKTLATLRADGSPRISGIEVEFADGQICLGMMPDSLKLNDLRRDPRLAVHSPTKDAPDGAEADWPGEAKIAGTAMARATRRWSMKMRIGTGTSALLPSAGASASASASPL